jgi:cytochrome bd-type quinol oxidase subunit 1
MIKRLAIAFTMLIALVILVSFGWLQIPPG